MLVKVMAPRPDPSNPGNLLCWALNLIALSKLQTGFNMNIF